MAETGKRKCLENVEGDYSIMVPKRGFYLRASFNFFSSKSAAFIQERLLLEGNFY